jgi:DNA-binding GntR family transcriptional regulator
LFGIARKHCSGVPTDQKIPQRNFGFACAISHTLTCFPAHTMNSKAPKKKAPGTTRNLPQRSLSAEEIYQKIQTAIMERRLLPGTKLVEERLAEVTGSSRARIRQVLTRLAHEQLVTLISNRGAFIARPTVEEARDLFLTRRLIEPGLARLLAQKASTEQIRKLRDHVNKERLARDADDLRSIIRLSGEFHIHLAEMAAPGTLPRVMRELTALTCLIITLYDKPNAPACPYTEHEELIDIIEQHDPLGAEQHMLEHLLHIERTLDLSGDEAEAPDLDSIFE